MAPLYINFYSIFIETLQQRVKVYSFCQIDHKIVIRLTWGFLLRIYLLGQCSLSVEPGRFAAAFYDENNGGS